MMAEKKNGKIYTDGEQIVEVGIVGTCDLSADCGGLIYYTPLLDYEPRSMSCGACFQRSFPYTVTRVEIVCGNRKATKVDPGRLYTDGVCLVKFIPASLSVNGTFVCGSIELLTPRTERLYGADIISIAEFLKRFPYKVDNFEVVVEE